MTTLQPANLKAAADEFETIFPSAVFSGIVGDAAHGTSGYHISIQNCTPGDYSIVRVDDAAPPGGWRRDLASAIDMSMNATDMALATQRGIAVWRNTGDTRRRYFNAFNGWTGSGDAQRYDFVNGSQQWASADHKWHVHTEIRRRFAEDPMAHKALVSMFRGESHDQWLASIGQTPAPAPAPAPTKRLLIWNGTPPMMYGDDVREVQQKLKVNYRSYAGSLVVDGWYGSDSKAKVTEFQRRAGLEVDGIVGPQTRARLGIAP